MYRYVYIYTFIIYIYIYISQKSPQELHLVLPNAKRPQPELRRWISSHGSSWAWADGATGNGDNTNPQIHFRSTHCPQHPTNHPHSHIVPQISTYVHTYFYSFIYFLSLLHPISPFPRPQAGAWADEQTAPAPGPSPPHASLSPSREAPGLQKEGTRELGGPKVLTESFSDCWRG